MRFCDNRKKLAHVCTRRGLKGGSSLKPRKMQVKCYRSVRYSPGVSNLPTGGRARVSVRPSTRTLRMGWPTAAVRGGRTPTALVLGSQPKRAAVTCGFGREMQRDGVQGGLLGGGGRARGWHSRCPLVPSWRLSEGGGGDRLF